MSLLESFSCLEDIFFDKVLAESKKITLFARALSNYPLSIVTCQIVIYPLSIMKYNLFSLAALAATAALTIGSCTQPEPQPEFCLGADISWSTAQEARGEQYYDFDGQPKDAFTLCREMGLDAVRLRVWVDPKEHDGHKWCDAQDVLAKALRAKAQGMDVMIDFHYSDFWADPAKQCIPAAWEKHSYDEMRQDVREHTLSVLQLLKTHDIEPRWVQVGNETSNGMLWSVERDSITGWEIKDEHGNTTITQSMGHWERNPEQYAGFFRSGAEAVKEVFPNAKVIVHLDNGFDKELYVKNLDILRRGGCKWDVVGMSLYPYWAMQGHPERTAQGVIDSTLVNIGLVAERYDCDVMIVETGFAVYDDQPEVMAEGRAQLEQIIRRARTETNGRCLGVFYWEPLCRPSQYRLGAFGEDGKPTEIMKAFKAAADHT